MNKYHNAAEILADLVSEGKIPGGSLMINEGNETVFCESFGWADEEKTRPVSENTIFRLASMTKPVATVAALILYEQGRLNLNASIADYLPEFKGTDKETVKIIHLLNHSCGLGMVMQQGMIQAIMLSDVQNDRLADRVAKWKDLVPDFPAGTATGYSPNVGFEILGRIIEVISGCELDVFLKDNIFEPLKIDDIAFILNDEQRSRRSILYHDPAAMALPLPGGLTLDDFVNADHNGYFSAAAGLNGSAAAYMRFAMMLANDGELDGVRILKPETVQMMHTASNDLLIKPGVRWGLGVEVFGKPEETGYYVHEGSYSWSGAYGTHFFIDPKAERTFVLMINHDNLGGSESYISRMIEKAIFEAE